MSRWKALEICFQALECIGNAHVNKSEHYEEQKCCTALLIDKLPQVSQEEDTVSGALSGLMTRGLSCHLRGFPYIFVFVLQAQYCRLSKLFLTSVRTFDLVAFTLNINFWDPWWTLFQSSVPEIKTYFYAKHQFLNLKVTLMLNTNFWYQWCDAVLRRCKRCTGGRWVSRSCMSSDDNGCSSWSHLNRTESTHSQ